MKTQKNTPEETKIEETKKKNVTNWSPIHDDDDASDNNLSVDGVGKIFKSKREQEDDLNRTHDKQNHSFVYQSVNNDNEKSNAGDDKVNYKIPPSKTISIKGEIKTKKAVIGFNVFLSLVVSLFSFLVALFVPGVSPLSQALLFGSGSLSALSAVGMGLKGRKDAKISEDLNKELNTSVNIPAVDKTKLLEEAKGTKRIDVLFTKLEADVELKKHKPLIAFLFTKDIKFDDDDKANIAKLNKILGDFKFVEDKKNDEIKLTLINILKKTKNENLDDENITKVPDSEIEKLDKNFEFYSYCFGDSIAESIDRINENLKDNFEGGKLLTRRVDEYVRYSVVSSWLNQKDIDGKFTILEKNDSDMIKGVFGEDLFRGAESRSDYINCISRKCLELEQKILSDHNDNKSRVGRLLNVVGSNLFSRIASIAAITTASVAAKEVIKNVQEVTPESYTQETSTSTTPIGNIANSGPIYSGSNDINSLFDGKSSTHYASEAEYKTALASYYVEHNKISQADAEKAAQAIINEYKVDNNNVDIWKANLSKTGFQAFQAKNTRLVQLDLNVTSVTNFPSEVYGTILIPNKAYDTGEEIFNLTQKDIDGINDPYIKKQVQAEWDNIQALRTNPTADQLKAFDGKIKHSGYDTGEEILKLTQKDIDAINDPNTKDQVQAEWDKIQALKSKPSYAKLKAFDGKVTYPYSSMSDVMKIDPETITDTNLKASIIALQNKAKEEIANTNSFIAEFYPNGIDRGYLNSILGSQSDLSNKTYALNDMINDAGGWDKLTPAQQNACIQEYNKLLSTNITDPELMKELTALSNSVNGENKTMSELFKMKTVNENLTNGVLTSRTHFELQGAKKPLNVVTITPSTKIEVTTEEISTDFSKVGVGLGGATLAANIFIPKKETTNEIKETKTKMVIFKDGQEVEDAEKTLEDIIEYCNENKKTEDLENFIKTGNIKGIEINGKREDYKIEAITDIQKTLSAMSTQSVITKSRIEKMLHNHVFATGLKVKAENPTQGATLSIEDAEKSGKITVYRNKYKDPNKSSNNPNGSFLKDLNKSKIQNPMLLPPNSMV